MIFFLITFLAWAILGIGMLGIDWGYATWSQARLQAAAQPLALDSFFEHPNHRLNEAIVSDTMRLNSSTRIERIFFDPNTVQVQLSGSVGLPIDSFSIAEKFSEEGSPGEIQHPVIRDRSLSPATTDLQFEVATTTVAKLHPARQVGMSRAGQLALPGALPCVLAREFWETMPVEDSIVATVNSFGQIFVDRRKIGQFNQIVTHIGQPVDDSKPLQTSHMRLEGYVPVFEKINAQDRIVGFGIVKIDVIDRQVSISKKATRTASKNASTQFTGDVSEMNHEEFVQVFSMNHTLKDAVLAPTLM